MIGFVLALLYVAYSVVIGTSSNEAVVNTFGFLWNWHVFWGIVIASFFVIAFMFCIDRTFFSNNHKSKGAFLGLSLFAIPFLVVIAGIRQSLFLGSIVLFCKAGTACGNMPWNGVGEALPWNEWSIAPCVIGVVMYIAGILLLRSGYNSGKND
jgi:hypothetical protein